MTIISYIFKLFTLKICLKICKRSVKCQPMTHCYTARARAHWAGLQVFSNVLNASKFFLIPVTDR